MNMKRIAFLFLCLFVFLYSGHCQKNFDHYHLTIKAIKEGNISDFEKNIKHIKNYCCPIKPLYTAISSLNPAEIGMISSYFKSQAPIRIMTTLLVGLLPG